MAKKTIMLVCSAGMSTSLLVTKMQKAAEAKGIDSDIFAVSASDADNNLANKDVDVLLLGPQVRFMKADFEKRLEPKGIPLDCSCPLRRCQKTDFFESHRCKEFIQYPSVNVQKYISNRNDDYPRHEMRDINDRLNPTFQSLVRYFV